MLNRSKILHNLCRGGLKGCQQAVTRKQLRVISACSTPALSHSHDLASKRLTKHRETPDTNKFANRTHTCGELTIDNVGEKVRLNGWLEFQRMGKFLILRDSYGATQLIVKDDTDDLTKEVENFAYETVISIVGTVVPRPEGQANKKMNTGEIEVEIDSLEILNPAEKQLPFSIRHFNKAKESLRMQYRYLDLRFPEMQRNLRLRSKILMKMREYLVNRCDFVDVETPTLFKRTPGGAQEFVVPTRHPGQFYSLVQSPQQFKQLLMIGGIDRYFQIARCYRDEGSRQDRQPEFTQLDIEMSFTDREGIMSLIEGLLLHCWPEELGQIQVPFKHMTYSDAMEFYGSDKPDLQIPYKLKNLTEDVKRSDTLSRKTGIKYDDKFGVYAVVFPKGNEYLTHSIKAQLGDSTKKQFTRAKILQQKISGDSWKKSLNPLFSDNVVNDIEQKLGLKEGDLLFLAYGQKTDAQEAVGKLRVEFANILESKGLKVRSLGFDFLWVIDFPLFLEGETEGSIESAHHPFTLPHSEDTELLTGNPLKVRGLHYDLVMNGCEIGGGSIRIHNPNLQRKVLEMLNIDTRLMSHLLEALASGAPPHGGIALGLDRFIAMLCKAPSIRDVIAFPKTMEGRDLMSGAPVPISEEEKLLYHIKTLDNAKG